MTHSSYPTVTFLRECESSPGCDSCEKFLGCHAYYMMYQWCKDFVKEEGCSEVQSSPTTANLEES